MKIVLLNTFECSGGASIACNRLMHALQKAGMDVKLIVRDKVTENPHIIPTSDSWLRKASNYVRFVWERLIIFVYNKFNKANLFAVSIANRGTDISKTPAIKEADIIHIHWTNQGFLSLKNIRQLILLGKPMVWTMHDMWNFTGVCHYAGDCEKYCTECHTCPLLGKTMLDKTKHIFQKKKKLFSNTDIHFVGCSQWMANCAGNSTILKNATITSIPNPIDVDVYKPVDKQIARQKLNLPADSKLILFASAKLSDPRKGMAYFIEAIKRLPNDHQIEIVLLGGKLDEHVLGEISRRTHALGYLHTPDDMAMVYAACDIFVIPSLEDNLPNTVMESMACGVPCVGFDVGGIPELIDHKINGYIAKSKSSEDLAKGISWTLFEADYTQLSENARHKVRTHYTEEIVAKQYLELYQKASEQPT